MLVKYRNDRFLCTGPCGHFTCVAYMASRQTYIGDRHGVQSEGSKCVLFVKKRCNNQCNRSFFDQYFGGKQV